MATKDHVADANSKTFVPSLHISNDQYSNLDLNSFHHSSSQNTCFSKDNVSKKHETPLDHLYSPKKGNDKMWNKLNGFSKNMQHSTLNNFKNDIFEKRWKAVEEDEESSTNSSTLSLHIAAYENSNEATNDDIASIQQQQQLSLIEFPRQQDSECRESEVMKFKSSQKLLNPNESDDNNVKLVDKLSKINLIEKPQNTLILSRYDNLLFKGHFDGLVTAAMSLFNPSSKIIAFKFLAKEPSSFSCFPQVGIVNPADNVWIQIMVHPITAEKRAALEADKSQFLLKWFTVDNNASMDTVLKNEKEMDENEGVKAIWSKDFDFKKDIMVHKFGVVFREDQNFSKNKINKILVDLSSELGPNNDSHAQIDIDLLKESLPGILNISPPSIMFKCIENLGYAKLQLTNIHQTCVYFKVVVSNPEYYTVKQPMGILKPAEVFLSVIIFEPNFLLSRLQINYAELVQSTKLPEKVIIFAAFSADAKMGVDEFWANSSQQVYIHEMPVSVKCLKEEEREMEKQRRLLITEDSAYINQYLAFDSTDSTDRDVSSFKLNTMTEYLQNGEEKVTAVSPSPPNREYEQYENSSARDEEMSSTSGIPLSMIPDLGTYDIDKSGLTELNSKSNPSKLASVTGTSNPEPDNIKTAKEFSIGNRISPATIPLSLVAKHGNLCPRIASEFQWHEIGDRLLCSSETLTFDFKDDLVEIYLLSDEEKVVKPYCLSHLYSVWPKYIHLLPGTPEKLMVRRKIGPAEEDRIQIWNCLLLNNVAAESILASIPVVVEPTFEPLKEDEYNAVSNDSTYCFLK